MSNDFGLYLGPLFGFLFTTGTLLFIVFNAHRTSKPEALVEATAPAPAAPAVETPVAETPVTETPVEQPDARS